MVHLAITNEVAKELKLQDLDRLRFGSILPDCTNEKDKSHLKIRSEKYSMYDLEGFRKMFEDKLLNDSLYLGYYLHLLQDALYRIYLCEIKGYNPRIPGNREKLYHDYNVLNRYVIDKYNLSLDMIKEPDIEKEPIKNLDIINSSKIIGEYREYFESEKGDTLIFSKEMLDEFIEKAIELCLVEAKKLINKEECIKNSTLRWKRPS